MQLQDFMELQLPYYPISQQYKKIFGQKVYKIPISVAESCPNRDGLKGMKTCIFCDEWGSAAYPEVRKESLTDQFQKNKKWILSRVNVNKFLVYFQAYTNTFSKVSALAELMKEAGQLEEVVGFVIGTRPDCVSDSVFKLWNEHTATKKVFVELGVQSFSNEQLRWMERGHTAEKSLWAVHKVREKCPQVNLGIHLIFGFEHENDDDVISAARICNELPIDNVKLHNLHVLKNTPLADLFLRGQFKPLEIEEYTRRVVLFLEHLSPDIAVHRLTALSRRSEELLAPLWTAQKMQSYQYILNFMKSIGAYQGRLSRC